MWRKWEDKLQSSKNRLQQAKTIVQNSRGLFKFNNEETNSPIVIQDQDMDIPQWRRGRDGNQAWEKTSHII